jgi:hypothetical protein
MPLPLFLAMTKDVMGSIFSGTRGISVSLAARLLLILVPCSFELGRVNQKDAAMERVKDTSTTS